MAKDNKRKSPKQSRSSEMLSDILEGTKLGLKKFGGGKLSTNKISEITGISVGSFYQYFKNKEAAFLELSEKLGDSTNEKMAEVINETQDAPLREKVEFMVDAYTDLFLSHKSYFYTLTQVVIRFNKSDLFLKRRMKFQKLAAEVLEKETGKTSEECTKFSHFLINMITGSLHALAQYEQEYLTPEETKAYIRSSTLHLIDDFLKTDNT